MDNLNKYTPSKFELVFPIIPGDSVKSLGDNNELILNVQSTVIPGVDLNTETQRWMGWKAQNLTGEITFSPWSFSFVVDSNFYNWKRLFKWLMFVTNNKDNYNLNPHKYRIDSTLIAMDNFGNRILNLFFVSVVIQGLTEVSLSYKEGDQILSSNVNLLYDRYELRD